MAHVEKLIGVAALTITIELVFFKFVPDLGTALIQGDRSTLTDFATFEHVYLSASSVHHARFLGNYTLYYLARMLSHVYHSADPRLHPLRVAAAMLTPVYAYLGAHFALRNGSWLAWREFLVPYGLAVFVGLYVFYPGDMPALACLSMGLFFVLERRWLPALLSMLLTGLFRESAFHMVAFVALWAWCDRAPPLPRRLAWLGSFALAFMIEYVVVRHFFPGPLSASGGISLDPRYVFLGSGMLSLTTLCSLSLAALFPVAYWVAASARPDSDWRRRFFLANCSAFPAWIVFYRMLSGNISEFRLLLPVLLPCIYGLAYEAGATARSTESLDSMR